MKVFPKGRVLPRVLPQICRVFTAASFRVFSKGVSENTFVASFRVFPKGVFRYKGICEVFPKCFRGKGGCL